MATSPQPLEALLEALLERPGQVARNPRAAIEAGIAQLRRVRHPEPRGGDAKRNQAEYRIDDLARMAGMTTRNVRAYQDRGLLPPPRRSGRVALYNESHVSRLRLIGSMLERGYTTAHISEMLGAWERGKDLAEVLGVEEELIRPWGDDQPQTMPMKEARALAGDKAAWDRLVSIGMVKVQGQKVLVTRPKLLAGFAEMRRRGMPMDTVLDLHEHVQGPIDDVAGQLVITAARHFATVKGPNWVPDADELGDLTEELSRFRELAVSSVMGTLANSMEKAVENVLGAYLAHLAGQPEDGAEQNAG